MNLAARIRDLRVAPGSLAIFWIAQAGFVYKTSNGQIIYIDPYLTDAVARRLGDVLYGFKRLTPSLIAPEEVDDDWVVTTHEHLDHFDADAMPILARNPRIRFVGAPDCQTRFAEAGIAAERVTILRAGETVHCDEVSLTGVYADHGDLAPEAIGVILQVGDSAYRPDRWQDICARGVDVLIAPINGAFGNMNGVEAAHLAHACRARVAIPCHFWMFAEHNGDPAQFLQAMRDHAPEVEARLLGQGECFAVTSAND